MSVPFGGPPATGGTVHLVGGGPGDPGLLGLRAAQLLATATVVAYDRLAPPEALTLCPEACARVYVGKLPDRHALSQEEINALLVERALAGEAVVRLKGGDPFVLGRGSEEAAACVAAGVPFEVVPAVTAGVAVPAYAGIPVTHRGVAPAFAVVTGHEDPTKPDTQVDYDALAAFPGTLLLYMGVGRLPEIAAALVAAGKPASTPVAVVRWGTTPRQETLTGTLDDIATRVAATGFANPAIIVVGDVVALRDQIGWFEPEQAPWVRARRPLHGVSVLVPRTRHQASELSGRLRALGAEPVEAPTITIEPTRDPERLRACLARVAAGAWDWLALTSANGVAGLWEQVEALGLDARLFAGVRIAAVGPGTADALAGRGLRADVVPDRFTTRGLADALVAGHQPARILLARADLATPALTEALDAAGWDTTEVEAYRTAPAAGLPLPVRERLAAGDIDVAAFASSSTVRNFVALVGGEVAPALRVASIGPVTSATCRELGLRVDAEADPHDLDGLVAAVVAAATSR
ncbi:MAG: uroporphyrinogen-III C-methyltransferase [Egibacteraceae bacterium]